MEKETGEKTNGPSTGSELLDGGWQTTVVREGNVIRRSPSPWSSSVLSFLRHLADQGFPASPRVIGTGFGDQGYETLSYLEGVSPQPSPWSDDAVFRIGEMVAQLHRRGSSFPEAEEPRIWKAWFGRDLGDGSQTIGHGDLGPWNIMAVDGVPTGFIDWDTAGPIDPVWELAQVAWLNAQLHDDDIAERVGLGDAKARAHQLGLILDGYKLPATDRVGFVDKMVEFAVRSARAEVVEHRVSPDTTAAVADNGYPILWGIAWRVRSAAWMLENRQALEAAIGGRSAPTHLRTVN